MRVGLAADHEGLALKNEILASFQMGGIVCVDFGAFVQDPDDDYPNFVIPLARSVAARKNDRGIAICGSGIGACIAANKVQGVRAGIISDVASAKQGVEDDDMNVICLAGRLLAFPLARELVRIFLETSFSGKPRHQRRLAEISELEKPV